MRYDRFAETPFMTFGDSDEPAVPEQVKMIEDQIDRRVRALLVRIEDLERRIAQLEEESA